MERFEDKLPAQLVQDLRWVRGFITEHPERFDMRDWLRPADSGCGTVGCIAVHLACRRLPNEKVQSALELDLTDGGFALSGLVARWEKVAIPYELKPNFYRLFYVDEWPEQFIDRYDEHFCTNETTPELAIARIDYFLEHGK